MTEAASPITMIDHGDHLADSFMGDVRVVRRQRAWALAVRGDGGQWDFSGVGPKRELLALAVMALPHKYPAMFFPA